MGFPGWDEQELVRRCKDGSESAYAELVRRHRQRLLNLAFRLVGNRETAEDVVQETFIAAFRTMERFQPKPALAPWLNTITVRLAGKAASRRAATPDRSLDRMLDPEAGPGASGPGADGVAGPLVSTDSTGDPHAAAEAAELRRAVAAAMTELPFKHRAAVVLRFVMGLDYAEAAQTLDLPLNTYKSHLLRGTRQLRETLGPLLAAAPPEPIAVESAAGAAPSESTAGAVSAAPTTGVTPAAAPHLLHEKRAER